MDVNIITDNEYVKGATLELKPSELILIQAALREFYRNKSRNWYDRVAADKMYGQIYDAVKGVNE